MNVRPKYNVQISPVREVALRGTADLAFWQRRLADEGVAPSDECGKAHLLITSVDSRFFGLRFRELSIALFLGAIGEDGNPEAVFLVHAFNSLRLFAFVERTFYHTPYDPARIRVEAAMPGGFQAALGEQVIVRAEMSSPTGTARGPARSQMESVEVPILLPRAGLPAPQMFFARLEGQTRTYPVTPQDTLTLNPTEQAPVIGWLVESGFRGTQWSVRDKALHARTKSVGQDSLPLFAAAGSG